MNRWIHRVCYKFTVTDDRPSVFERDVRWLMTHAVRIGIALALLCHCFPPRYRVVCHRISHCFMADSE